MSDRTISERDSDREPGFYWVRKSHEDEWEVGCWIHHKSPPYLFWYVTTYEDSLNSDDLVEIDERRLVREL